MKTELILCLAVFIISGCKKHAEKITDSGNDFSVSMQNLTKSDFGFFEAKAEFSIVSTDVDIEYGFVFGTQPEPVIENSTIVKIGQSKKTAKYSSNIQVSDVTKIYYVRAYARLSSKIVYSHSFLPTSPVTMPSIFAVDSVLSFVQDMGVFVTTKNIGVKNKILLTLDGIPLRIKLQQPDGRNYGFFFLTDYPSQLLPGSYTLELTIDNIKLTYKNKVVLLPGKWENVGGIPEDFNNLT